jgi:hypothetical protein
MMTLTMYLTMVVRVSGVVRVDQGSDVVVEREGGRVWQKIGQLNQCHHEHTD